MNAPISKALADAGPADRIHFQLKHPRGILAPTLTTGILYIKDDHIQVIFSTYRHSSPIRKEENDIRFKDPQRVHYSQPVRIIPGPFQRLADTKRSDLKNRWLLIDHKSLLASAPKTPKPAVAIQPDLEEKLSTLKSLWEKGLITEDEYQEKKKELLKEL